MFYCSTLNILKLFSFPFPPFSALLRYNCQKLYISEQHDVHTHYLTWLPFLFFHSLILLPSNNHLFILCIYGLFLFYYVTYFLKIPHISDIINYLTFSADLFHLTQCPLCPSVLSRISISFQIGPSNSFLIKIDFKHVLVI